MVVDLMWDDAAVAREVVANATPRLTRESYLTFQRSVKRHEVFDGTQLTVMDGQGSGHS
jgi:hypothetical protein